MSGRVKLLARVAVFSALVFASCYAAVFLPNVNPCFFVVFTAGFLWGVWPGMTVGVVGFFLWSVFNPYGPVVLPLLVSQLVGISFSGIIGAVAARIMIPLRWGYRASTTLIFSGLICGLLYHLVVDVVDALIYQPFWPRLAGGAVFSLITVGSNAIIFPLFYTALAFLKEKESQQVTGL
ncbi:MAG: ECF transporter S component [Candidatus Zixiibacteriota bacterium]|nr:MAG: ECF transporter S component [candidate division Zixibacteria bacterium]